MKIINYPNEPPFEIGDSVLTDFYSYGSNKLKECRKITSIEWKGKGCQTGWWVCAKNKQGLNLCCDAAWFEKENPGFFGAEKNARRKLTKRNET